MAIVWAFSTYTFPTADSPGRGQSGEWNDTEKLIEQEPLNADVTILASWGFRSRTRSISGICGQATRDAMRTFHRNGTRGTLTDPEGRTVEARIVAANFNTLIPTGRYRYTIEFKERA